MFVTEIKMKSRDQMINKSPLNHCDSSTHFGRQWSSSQSDSVTIKTEYPTLQMFIQDSWQLYILLKTCSNKPLQYHTQLPSFPVGPGFLSTSPAISSSASTTIHTPSQLMYMYSQNQPVQWAVQTTHILCMIQPTYMKQCNFVRARSTARTTCQTQEFDVMCLAFFPGATQLSVACSMEKQNRAWHVFACKYCQFYKKISLSNHAHYLAIEKRLSYSLILAKTHPVQWVTLHNI